MIDIPSMQRAGANAVKAMIDDVIAEKLDVTTKNGPVWPRFFGPRF